MAGSLAAEGATVAAPHAPRARAQGRRLLLLTNGSRGDVQPFIALGQALQQAGFSVRIHTNANLAGFVRSMGLDAVGTNVDAEAVMNDNPNMRHCMATGDIVAFTKCMAEVNRAAMPETFAAKRKDVEAWRPDAILTGILELTEATALGGTHGIPVILMGLVSSSFPAKDQQSLFGEPAWLPHRIMGTLFSYLWFRNEFDVKYPTIREQMPEAEAFMPTSFRQYMYGVFHPITPVLVGFSPSMQSVNPDWSQDLIARVRFTGVWALSKEKQEERLRVGDDMFGGSARSELDDFLAKGSPPVYMGWGSMISVSPEHMTCLAVRTLMQVQARGIVLGGFAGLDPGHLEGQPDSAAMAAYAREHVFFVKTAPHEWLFPQCAALVHHGGAGTMSAALRSGVPSVLTPVAFDQFDHVQLVAKHGVGKGLRHFSKVTVAELAAAVMFCMHDEGVRQRAQAFGGRMRAEDGLGCAVRAVDDFLVDDLATGAWRARFKAQTRGLQVLKSRRPPSWLAWCARLCCSLHPNDYSVKLPAQGLLEDNPKLLSSSTLSAGLLQKRGKGARA